MVESSYLAHHGVKGMKWGVRRYQNEDGTYTAAGKARLKKLDDKKQLNAAYNEFKKNSHIYSSPKDMARSSKKWTAAQIRYDKSNSDFKDAKIREKLAKQSKKSTRQLKLEQKYIDQGLTKDEAAIRAYKQMRTEKFMIAAAATALAAGAAYGGYKLYQDRADQFIKKGAKLSRVANESEHDLYDMFYAADNKKDSAKYKGLYAQQIKRAGGDPHVKSLEVTDSIKRASPKHARDTLKELASKDESFKSDLKDILEKNNSDAFVRILRGDKQNKTLDKAVRDIRKGKITKNVYDGYNFAIGSDRGDKTADSVRNKFIGAMKAKGYDAIQDVNDKKLSGYRAKNPLIFLGNDKVRTNSVSKLSDETINKLGSKEINKLKAIEIAKLLVKDPSTLASLGIAGAAAGGRIAYSKYTKKADDKLVQQYRKKHPNSKETYNEIREKERLRLARVG